MKKSSIFLVLAAVAMVIPEAGANPRFEMANKVMQNRAKAETTNKELDTSKVEAKNVINIPGATRRVQASKPYSNGKKAIMAHLDFAKCLKNGAMRQLGSSVERSNPEGASMNRKVRKPKINLQGKMVNKATKTAKINTRRFKVREPVIRYSPHMESGSYGVKKGKLSQFNTTMIIKSGVMKREDAIRARATTPKVGLQRKIPSIKSFRRGPERRPNLNIKFRERVGGRCFGHNCR